MGTHQRAGAASQMLRLSTDTVEHIGSFVMDKHKRGAIVRIKCKGFLTYRTVTELRPGPRLNMVLGPGGTGKSTIMCAICIGLGGHPKLLGRSVKLADYVAHNESVAMIEIELHNPDGANRTIWRQLTRKAEDEEKVTSAYRRRGRHREARARAHGGV